MMLALYIFITNCFSITVKSNMMFNEQSTKHQSLKEECPSKGSFFDISNNEEHGIKQNLWGCGNQKMNKVNATLCTLSIYNSKFSELTGTKGGAIFIRLKSKEGPTNKSDSIIQNCIFDKCISTYNGGGAIYLELFFSNCDILNCQFYENDAKTGSGGALYFSETGGHVTNCYFKNNKAKTGAHLYYDQRQQKYKWIASYNTFEECDEIGMNKGVIHLKYNAFTNMEFTNNIIRSTCSKTIWAFYYTTSGNKKGFPKDKNTKIKQNSLSSNVEIVDSKTEIYPFAKDGFGAPIPTATKQVLPASTPTPKPTQKLLYKL